MDGSDYELILHRDDELMQKFLCFTTSIRILRHLSEVNDTTSPVAL